ncbi:MAG: glycosyltransferase family 2 protein [Burkholderiaceae bacterium]|jgi:glycosyltransferase involved in cell wall biosynthesis
MSRARRCFFSVITPTYNRASTLERAYESLCDQSFQDFEWIVVDDGSTDRTPNLVQAWQRQARFPIRYHWQENQHKKTAFNRGVAMAHGQFVVVLDSDDHLDTNALFVMARAWKEIPANEHGRFVAITGLCARPDGKIVGDMFPGDVIDTTAIDMTFRYRVRGEKFGCMRTDVLRRFPFPENIPGYVPESVVWWAIARAGYKTRFVNQVFRVYHDTPDSLTRDKRNSSSQAVGLCLLARDTLVTCLPWFRYRPLEFILAAARYTRFRLTVRHLGQYLPQACRLAGFVPRLLVGVMFPLGLALYVRDRVRV